ncbi:ABC transporter substrate-binding protein [Microbacterium sp. NPDC058342]|uniref:ABC transporter substrate-binding protein n=1 Tax=Microbacterium sp. NPDC058342 TaxID=3346454 RepID=UPI00365672B2
MRWRPEPSRLSQRNKEGNIMRKPITLVAAGITTVLVLSGCSSSGDAADGTVTLQMVESLTNPARTQLLKSLIADFEAEHENITVNLISPPTDGADQKIQQMLQSGTGIDVFEVRDNTVGPFNANGWIYDMSDEIKSWEGWSDLTATAQEFSQLDGKTLYIPYGFYVKTLFERTDLLEAAGLESPASWQDLLDAAVEINDPDDNTYGWAYRGGTEGYSHAAIIMEAYAADDLDPTNAYRLQNGNTLFSSPEAAEGLQLSLDLFNEASPPSSVAWGYPEMVESFSAGTSGFLMQTSEVIATIQESTSVAADQWNTTPLPVGPTGKAPQPLGSNGWGIAESSAHKTEAIELIEFLSSGETSLEFSKGNNLVPILLSAEADPYFTEGPWASYLKMNEDPEVHYTVQEPRSVTWWSEWAAKANTDFQSMLIGDRTVGDVLADWDAYWTEKWDQAKE